MLTVSTLNNKSVNNLWDLAEQCQLFTTYIAKTVRSRSQGGEEEELFTTYIANEEAQSTRKRKSMEGEEEE